MAEDRGSFGYRYDDSENKVIIVRWNDHSAVALASNCQPVNPVFTVSPGITKQYSQKEKKIVDVPEPYLVRYYNQKKRVDLIG